MQDTLNPLTAIEAVAEYHDWECSLLSETEIVIIIPDGTMSTEDLNLLSLGVEGSA